jgi:hypothetical protein
MIDGLCGMSGANPAHADYHQQRANLPAHRLTFRLIMMRSRLSLL